MFTAPIKLHWTLDITNALTGVYVWILFGFLSSMLNCDLQRFLRANPLFIHLIGFISVFLLFTLLESKDEFNLMFLVVKTIIVYFLFLFMTKSKWYFTFPVLIMLMLDQIIKKQIEIQKRKGEESIKQEQFTNVLTYIIIFCIIFGTLHYIYLQKLEYKNKFSLYKFLLMTNIKCKKKMPFYNF